MVDSDVLLSSNKEEWLIGMEASGLGLSLGLAERLLGVSLAQVVNQNRWGTSFGANGDKVVSLDMPSETGNFVAGEKSTKWATGKPKGAHRFAIRFDRMPFYSFCSLFGLDIATTLGFAQKRLGNSSIMGTFCSRSKDNCTLSNCRKQTMMSSIWVPFHGNDGLNRIVILIAIRIHRFCNLRQVPAAKKTPSLDFPKSDNSIRSTTCQKLTIRAAADTSDNWSFVTIVGCLVLDALCCRKWSQITCFWKLGNKALWINIQTPLHHARTEVEVQATLKCLTNRVLVSSNRSKIWELFGNQKTMRSVLDFHFFPLLEFLFRGNVFIWWDVTLCMSWRGGLWCCNVLRSLSHVQLILFCSSPKQEWGIWIFILVHIVHVTNLSSQVIHGNVSLFQLSEQTVHLHFLPFTWLEFRLGQISIGIQTRNLWIHTTEVVNVVWISVMFRMSVSSILNSSDNLQLTLCQFN
mmetsp:Transcript_35031/g.84805  ORF Transcript_35031/g.84805 Transcript_35031/m.84805 type:complete len:463 (+) Transcript_35031:480-1868(+)